MIPESEESCVWPEGGDGFHPLSSCPASRETLKLHEEGETVHLGDSINHRCGPATRSRDTGRGLPKLSVTDSEVTQ